MTNHSDSPYSETIELSKAFVRLASVTPHDAGCQALLRERLENIGFRFESLVFDDVNNC